MTAPAIETCNAELRTVREAMRGLNHLIAALDAGEVQKIVLVQNTRMRAVLLTVEEYARLADKQGGTP
jgi:PHD/YefM family antitoxin component YafN of YafNO toxin-antitoxin module